MANIQEIFGKVKETAVKINEEHPEIWKEFLVASISGAISCAVGMLIGVRKGYVNGLTVGYSCCLFKMKGGLG